MLKSSEQVVKVLQPVSETATTETLTYDTLKRAYEQLRDNYDNIYGGFGTSPKFPTPIIIPLSFDGGSAAMTPQPRR